MTNVRRNSLNGRANVRKNKILHETGPRERQMEQ